MQAFEDWANKYNATISRFRGLEIISVPVRNSPKTDVGFSKHEKAVIGKLLPCFARKEFGGGLYAYGDFAEIWSSLLDSDDDFCVALRTLLDRYAYCVEWTGSKLSARINKLQATPSGDGTGGQRFFASLTIVADRLGSLSENGKLTNVRGKSINCGPARFRRLTLTAAFILPFFLLLTLHYVFAR